MDWLLHLRANCMERTLAGLDWLARRRGAAPMPAHLATGLEGEQAAYFHLLRKGYQVVAQRWSAGNLPGDIDLIAWQGSLLCFIEVKARTARDATPAEVAVDAHKRATLRRLAHRYLRELPPHTLPQQTPSQQSSPPPAPPQVRFDVISVYLLDGRRDCLHFENAFGWTEHRRDWD